MYKRQEEIKAAAHFTGQGVDDFAGMYFGYADGKKLSISCGMCTSQRADRFYLYGTEGTLEAPIPYNAKWALHYSCLLYTSFRFISRINALVFASVFKDSVIFCKDFS